MKSYYITFRSVTHAQRAQEALSRAGIRTALGRTPRNLEQRGCGYRLQTEGMEFFRAVELLGQKGIAYSRLFAARPDGTWEEVRL